MAEERSAHNPSEPDPVVETSAGIDAVPSDSDTDKDASTSAGRRAEEALDSVADAAEAVEAAAGADFPAFAPDVVNGDTDAPPGINLLGDVSLRVKIELGRTQMYVEDVLRLNTDSVIELDKAAGDPVDIYVNDRHVARGEVLVLNENFCVRVSEIIHSGQPNV